jgi:hypothetical protein
MFNFKAKFLRKPTTTIIPDAATDDASKTTTTANNHLQSRLLQERRANQIANKPQNRTLAAGVPSL